MLSQLSECMIVLKVFRLYEGSMEAFQQYHGWHLLLLCSHLGCFAVQDVQFDCKHLAFN